MPKCRTCISEKPLEDFPRNKTYASGRASICKLCQNIKAKEYRNPIKEAMYKYGITKGRAIELKQKTYCEICFAKMPEARRLCIDHNHKHGHIRGVLCDACNTGIGKFKDDPMLLRAAVRYLEKND